MKQKYQAGFTHLVAILLLIVVLGSVGGVSYYVWHKNHTLQGHHSINSSTLQPSAVHIATYEDCKKANGSKLLTTYPAQCITKAGQTFTDTSDATVAWTQYIAPDNSYKMKIPDGWNINQNSETEGILQIRDDSLAVKPGVKGTFYVTPGYGKSGDSGLTINFYSPQVVQDNFDNAIKGAARQPSLKTKAGVEIQKYTYLQTVDSIGPGLKKDGKAYIYGIFQAGKLVLCYYSINPDQVDYHTNVELALQTVQIL